VRSVIDGLLANPNGAAAPSATTGAAAPAAAPPQKTQE
jgi:hypothetical protein